MGSALVSVLVQPIPHPQHQASYRVVLVRDWRRTGGGGAFQESGEAWLVDEEREALTAFDTGPAASVLTSAGGPSSLFCKMSKGGGDRAASAIGPPGSSRTVRTCGETRNSIAT